MTTIKKSLFIPAKINHGSGTKDKWFVYYSYWNDDKKPSPGYDRLKVYEDEEIGLRRGNSIADRAEKHKYFTKLATHVNGKLSCGWSPFGYSRKSDIEFITIDKALSEVIDKKEASLADTAFKSFRSHIRAFKTWLLENGLSHIECKEITTAHISRFLTSIQVSRKLSNRTINNHLIDLRSCYEVLMVLGYVKENKTEGIDFLNAKSNKHEAYEMEQVGSIADYMNKTQPYLQLYCRFIWMGFRPIEIVRLRIYDLNLEKRKIRLYASNEKTGEAKYRPLLETFVPEIEKMNLDNYPRDYFLFSAKGHPSEKGTTRDYFTDKFKKVKDHFKFPPNYTMYGLRHTMAIELEKSGESLVNIMKITGHRTIAALEAYLRKHMNTPAQDVSHRFTVTI